MINDVIHKKDLFPKTIGAASHLLSKWTNNYGGKYNIGKSDSNDGMAFAMVMEEKEKGKDDKNERQQNITCFKCKKKGHYSNECTEELPAAFDKKGTSLLLNKEYSSDEKIEDEQYEEEEENNSVTSEEYQMENQDKDNTTLDDNKTSDNESYEDNSMFSDEDYEGFAFVQDVTCKMNDKAGIPDSWILLDSQSSVDVFKNKKLLKNIHDAKNALSLHCDAGIAMVNKIGDLPGYGTVWFYEDRISNILSLNNVKKYWVTYDSTAYDCFEVHKADGTKRVFK